MKRNDIIEAIEGNLEAYHPITENNFKEVSANILATLEQLGMAPPEVAEPVKTSVLVATPHGYVEQKSEDSKVFVRKWEDE